MNLGNFLLIDASSPSSVLVGLLDERGNAWQAFAEEKSPALEGVFSATEKVAGTPPSGFIFCSGPGSILGIRIAAMAVRGWLSLGLSAPVLEYQSLNLAAALISRAFPREKNFAVLAESRMNCWNALCVQDSVPAENFCELKSAELTGTLPEKVFLFPQRRPTPPQLSVPAIPFFPAEFLRKDPAIFSEIPALLSDCGNAPDAINTSAAESYAKWSPERHRAGNL